MSDIFDVIPTLRDNIKEVNGIVEEGELITKAMSPNLITLRLGLVKDSAMKLFGGLYDSGCVYGNGLFLAQFHRIKSLPFETSLISCKLDL